MTEQRRSELLAMALTRITLLLSVYCVALAITLHLGDRLPSTTLISLPLQLLFLVFVLDFMKRSGFSAAEFGLRLGPNPGRLLAVAGNTTIPIIVILALVKLVFLPERDLWEPQLLGFLPLYLLSSFLQELIVRGGVQGMLAKLLPGRFPNARALAIATALFTVTHLHISTALTVASVPLGLFWGILYARQQSLVGVVFSHFVVGSFTFFFFALV